MTITLSTHVLNTAKGIPAKEMTVELWKLNDDDRLFLAKMVTNSDGRVSPQELKAAGIYELVFYVGEYFKVNEMLGEPRFLDSVPIRFGVELGKGHYHVPLLVSPWSYQTYRGS
ncbi:5-hydroxyisourate hydrolase [Metabacillus crassostreae]|uniref:hydroxyisourate hydrolase n=1 Tax=Metabacillus crassostreae TaxID=929098 RepID=UPI001959FD78|nr:hydroxyisourate hydrolase [Metabacillus crassostreae]MBM7603648.1 5-hydroxyisourate hydrolase [Metabacillus crassostreae]